ncbi:putative membrane protein [Acinetobacter johnsonii]|uniref:DUF4870 family protein n=1 Tax=Acinetobacter johnsonii TaxID=40214 RepID=UPI001617796C|nr:hypothetical protein [Acinetobacter johnsonii]MBB4808849.1 putative membrane protein [Acinetobacter johnsonii]
MNYSVDQDPNRSLTFILYILYIVAIFSAGILAIIALVINYVKRGSVRGSIFESHFTWQIRTFWWYLIWNVVAFVPFIFLFFTGENATAFAGVALGASTFCVSVIGLSWVWIVYRAIKGIIRLNDNQPMYQ